LLPELDCAPSVTYRAPPRGLLLCAMLPAGLPERNHLVRRLLQLGLSRDEQLWWPFTTCSVRGVSSVLSLSGPVPWPPGTWFRAPPPLKVFWPGKSSRCVPFLVGRSGACAGSHYWISLGPPGLYPDRQHSTNAGCDGYGCLWHFLCGCAGQHY